MIPLSSAAQRILEERYLRVKPDGTKETFEDMVRRVAVCAANGNGMEEDYYQMMVSLDFLPNSPTLMNAGTDNGLQFSACYVLPVEDNLAGIFDSIKHAAIIHKSGGGTGFSFSGLRPAGSRVGSSGGVASGPVSFLRVFDSATQAIKQGGTRRGANMGILRVDHPDIEEFIACKLDGGITNFNISVAITDEFMHAVTYGTPFFLVDPATKAAKEVRAKDLWDKIVRAAWESGDPGVIFIDQVNRSAANPIKGMAVEATNPCGEQPLYPYEACNLGSINLANMVNKHREVDYPKLFKTVHLATQFLDNIIDVNPYPLPEIDAAVKANRRIGLGVMGWADMLMRLGIPYESEVATDLARTLSMQINEAAVSASQRLAALHGPFGNYAKSIYADGPMRRNSTVTTIAPTGTISIIAGCSSGIEPLFAHEFEHRVGDRVLKFKNPVVEELGGTPGHPVFLTAHEVTPRGHVLMQTAWQSGTENAVSKTINLPNDATVEDVAAAYRLAYDSGCLGITVFRDGCKGYENQVLHREDPLELKDRGDLVEGKTARVVAPEGKVNVTLNNIGGHPVEVFVNVGKAGSDVSALAEGMGRLISYVLRLPGPTAPTSRLEGVIEQLANIGGSRSVGFGPGRVLSLPDAVAKGLAKILGGTQQGSSGGVCPDCGNTTFVMEEGCKKCHTCGYSEC